MSEQEKRYDHSRQDDPIPAIDLPVWVEDIILFASEILIRRFINKPF